LLVDVFNKQITVHTMSNRHPRLLHIHYSVTQLNTIFTVQSYASAIYTVALCPSLCQKLVLYQNG